MHGLIKRPYRPENHRPGTQGALGVCSWHFDCENTPTASYKTPWGWHAACPEAEERIEALYGPIREED